MTLVCNVLLMIPDYDPKEDRKAARQAERAEAKRRRLEMKQQDKIKEKAKKNLANKKKRATVKNRKKVLRQAYRNRRRKRKGVFEFLIGPLISAATHFKWSKNLKRRRIACSYYL